MEKTEEPVSENTKDEPASESTNDPASGGADELASQNTDEPARESTHEPTGKGATSRKRTWLLAAVGTAVVVVAGFAALRFFRRGADLEPIDVVPRDSFLVATIDLNELRRSPISEALLGRGKGDGTAKALGLGSLEAACGFDPLSRVERLAVAAPEEGERGDFGLAARVQVTRRELDTCTAALAKRRGSSSETRHVGRFTVLEDEQHRSIGYGAEGLLVVGKGSWFSTMLDVARKEAPGIGEAAEHQALRTALTSPEGWRAPAIVVTAILPRALRERLKKEMAGEASTDPSVAIMDAVLGVSGAGIAVRTGDATKNVDVRLELICDRPEACAEVDKLIQRKRLDASKDLALRMLGFGPLFDALETKVEGARLHASVGMNSAALAGAVDRALKLRGTRERHAEPPPVDRVPAPVPAPPGETLHTRDGGAGGAGAPDGGRR